jgi:membrane protease YdiL (CAAX protease family)
MRTLKTFIQKHSVVTYYALTFAISWGGIFLVIGPEGFPGTQVDFTTMLPFVILPMLAGPALSSLLLTGLLDGKAGLRALLARFLHGKAGKRRYAVALLIAPLLMTALPLALSVLYPEFLPGLFTKADKMSLLRLGLAAGLGAGFFEELGWTGFAIPRLRRRYDVLTTGLIVGFLWGAWHFLVNFWSSGSPSGGFSTSLFLHSFIFSIGVLPAYRVLMVRLYDRTDSLFLAVLMHMSLTTSNVIFVPLATGVPLVSWSLVLTGALWVIVAAVAAADRGPFSWPFIRRKPS